VRGDMHKEGWDSNVLSPRYIGTTLYMAMCIRNNGTAMFCPRFIGVIMCAAMRTRRDRTEMFLPGFFAPCAWRCTSGGMEQRYPVIVE
jgi:hypothetical protein